MKDSADIKWANKSLIRVLLRSGSAYTKQQIALQTGLSVASCNTYLNEMEAAGEVLGESRRLHDMGRSSVLYKLNERYESMAKLEAKGTSPMEAIPAAAAIMLPSAMPQSKWRSG